jgi:signal transduction histidine kinase
VPVLAGRLRISEVVANLLSNAIRYSLEGGEISVEVTRSEGEATVSVIDRGIGIPRDCQGRVFERLYRPHTDTPYDRGGIGFGLYLAKAFVESHGGRIWFDRAEDFGSTFSFSLPC